MPDAEGIAEMINKIYDIEPKSTSEGAVDGETNN